jgi:hypothetical protein
MVMRKLFYLLFTTVAISFYSSAGAQNFPATEKEVADILCSGKWTLVSMGKGEKMMPASELGFEAELQFKADSTYTATLFKKEKPPGNWKIDMTSKQVKLIEKTESSTITELSKTRFVVIAPKEEGDTGDSLKMIFEPAK